VNDPNELALLPEVISEVELGEPRDYHEFFWDDTRDPNFGRSVDYHLGIHTQVCRFNGRGEHIVMAKDCPHFVESDEEGKKVIPNWTAQMMNENLWKCKDCGNVWHTTSPALIQMCPNCGSMRTGPVG
jgi:hypothetical protein